MLPTLGDIARQTSTSISTVSRVLSGGRAASRISPETRDRVLAVSKALGYRPNLLARGLRTRKSNSVALLISDISNPFFGLVASLIERLLHVQGYSLVLCNSGGDTERESEYLRLLPQKAIDGLILVPVARTKRSLLEIVPETMPVVVFDRPIPGMEATVSSDHERAVNELCDRLCQAGVRSIGIVCGPQFISTHRIRCEMVSRRFNVLAVHEGRAQRETGRAAWHVFQPMRPDAIVCTNNFLAMGVMEEVQDPQTAPILAVCDQIPMMHLLPIPLIGVRQDAHRLASECVDQLMQMLNSEDARPQPMIIPAQIVTNRAFESRGGSVGGSSR